MEKPAAKNNTACALYQSRACAILNAETCESCPRSAEGSGQDQTKLLKENVTLFETLLPDGGVSYLFESETCTVCRTEPKGKADRFAILDFGHHEPEAIQARRLFQRSGVGFMMPLQFACCKKCGRRFILSAYLPLLVPAALTAVLIPMFVSPHLMQLVKSAAGWLPFALVLLTTGGGYLLGKVLQQRLSRHFDLSMYFDLLSHPASKALMEKGWFPLSRRDACAPILSRRRIEYGLGNAPSCVYAEKEADKIPVNREEIPENKGKAD